MNDLINELETIYDEIGDVFIRGYYKTVGGVKRYYDFQKLTESQLNGSYDMLEVLELLYYIEEQNRSIFINELAGIDTHE